MAEHPALVFDVQGRLCFKRGAHGSDSDIRLLEGRLALLALARRGADIVRPARVTRQRRLAIDLVTANTRTTYPRRQ